MEVIRGKTPLQLNTPGLRQRLAGYNLISLDLGTGDGRYVRSLAEAYRDRFFIGVDACRENLRAVSRKEVPNALFVIAGAQSLPAELAGSISHITINFPWGSLLQSLLEGDPGLINGLASVSRSCTALDIRLNGGALAEAAYVLQRGTEQIRCNLLRAGWQENRSEFMDARALKEFPSTWARRLAFGRDPRAVMLSFRKAEDGRTVN